PHRRADRRRGPNGDHHPGDLRRAIERRPPSDEAAQQPRAYDDLGQVAELLAGQAYDRQVRVGQEQLVVDDTLAEEDAGPPAEAPEVERGDAEAGGRPAGR